MQRANGDTTVLNIPTLYEESRRKGNDQEPMQSNSTSFLRHHTGKEHKQSRRHKENTAQAESQEVSYFPADVHQAILNITNK